MSLITRRSSFSVQLKGLAIKNFYYSLEINLENEHVRAQLDKQLKGLINADTMDFSVNSRFFGTSQACFAALNEDLNAKVDMLKVKESKDTVTSINETNPIYTNPPEALAEFKKDNPNFDHYLETWGDKELMRLTFTTEEFDEEQPPIISDDSALMFRYVMHELEDDLLVPDGKTLVENASSLIH